MIHNVRVVALTGALDAYDGDWQHALRDVDGDSIFIDLTGVTLLSAAFVGELARLRKRLPAARIRPIGATRQQRRILDLLRVDEMLQVPVVR